MTRVFELADRVRVTETGSIAGIETSDDIPRDVFYHVLLDGESLTLEYYAWELEKVIEP